MNLANIKAAIYQHCQATVKGRIQDLDAQMADLQASANQETKSTAGDKYETARAMAMIEKENLAKQKATFLQQLNTLNLINPKVQHQQAALGSLIASDQGIYYFIAISLGIVEIQAHKVVVISSVAPISQALIGQQEGAKVSFNGQHFTITQIS